MQPQLFVEVKLYPTGGREGPIIGPVYGCPCKLTADAQEARDCRILLDDQPLLLGEPRKVGVIFLNPESAGIFKAAGKF